MGVKGFVGDLHRYFSNCRVCGTTIPSEYRFYNECPLCPECLKK